ncbi:MAG TPA: chromate transporter [Aquabacterium sp.]|uniref:chromate transporter n=1 Tax=Aquabacterium sp. TaxID=1872578 RepID=UPI002E37792E|nr:chromate transporter [Aquabacterium sp.]HEX5373038.1 chromate transporter [Aquabacterium sp.]
MSSPLWTWAPDTWWALFGHFLALSLMSIGGAITLVPDMHRRLVVDGHLLSEGDFTAAIALAQAAPGPNVLFVALMGWYSGGLVGSVVSMLGIMIPSTTLALVVSRWVASRREALGVQAFQSGMAPVTVGLLLATGWILSPSIEHPRALLLSAVVAVLVWRTKISLIWLVAAGALLGALGWL